MLTVEMDKRITIDECLEHPWITLQPLRLTDSTDGLTGAMDQLDFSKRKVHRERTLLSSINDIKVSKIIELSHAEVPVKVFDKNSDGKRIHDYAPAVNAAAAKKGKENGAKGVAVNGARKEQEPAANRAPEEFMEMGGYGDQRLFANDAGSRYEQDEVPK